jgi:hypothetical protein
MLEYLDLGSLDLIVCVVSEIGARLFSRIYAQLTENITLIYYQLI